MENLYPDIFNLIINNLTVKDMSSVALVSKNLRDKTLEILKRLKLEKRTRRLEAFKYWLIYSDCKYITLIINKEEQHYEILIVHGNIDIRKKEPLIRSNHDLPNDFEIWHYDIIRYMKMLNSIEFSYVAELRITPHLSGKRYHIN